METLIPVENGDVLAAVRGFLRRLLEAGVVEALFVPLEMDGGAVAPALVADPERLSQANPLAPVMPINGARAVAALTGKHAPARIGAVLRACEMRALIELVKLQQATLAEGPRSAAEGAGEPLNGSGVVLIGLDCAGTYEVPDYANAQRAGRAALAEYLAAAHEGSEPALDGLTLRSACRRCVQPAPDNADIRLHLFGVDAAQGIPVTLRDEIGAALQMPEAVGAANGHEATLDRLVAAHAQTRERELAEVRTQLTANGGLAALFADCIRCHNCMTACPICYCKTCLFRTRAFDHPPEHYLEAARRKGAARMLGDTLLFHMTRLNHMSASCVNCGLCTSACPAGIPVGSIFSAVGDQVQAAFGYAPGRDAAEPLPLATFQASEWTEIGE